MDSNRGENPHGTDPALSGWPAAGAAFVTSGLLVWLFLPSLTLFAQRWNSDPQYSHGPLIPLIAIGLLWFRGVPEESRVLRPTWRGFPLLLGGLVLHGAGTRFYFEWLASISLIPVAAGAYLTLCGNTLFRRLWPSVVFLVFMIPLPYQIETAVLHPLQNLATDGSAFALQTLGYVTRVEGNLVWIGAQAVGVAEACSGLRMLTGFVAVAAAMCLLIDRERWKRSVLLLSSIPVALICNGVRVTLMGIGHTTMADATLVDLLHDVLGWLMPLEAVGLLWLELCVLDRLFVDEEPPVRTGEIVETEQCFEVA